MEHYRYQPLSHDDSIRLLAILPGKLNQSSIHCKIIPHRLSHPFLYFEALSYTWGDAADQVTIFCGDASNELQVTRNCYNAMLHLRLEDSLRLIWIDAICIDQKNTSERTAQVRMMGSIYQAADQVVVYIGEENAETRLVYEKLYAIQSLGWNGRPNPGVEIVRELDNMILRPWFTRVWVAQEVLVAKHVVMQCGTLYVPMWIFKYYIWGYDNRTGVTDRITTIKAPFVLTGAFDNLKASRRILATEHDAAISLWRALDETSLLSTSDPRDRIFALNAFIPNVQGMNQIISYDRSIDKVFTDVALFLLPHIELGLLFAVQHPHSLAMPSWVPDWSQNTLTNMDWLLHDDELDTLCFVEAVEGDIAPTPGYLLVAHNENYSGKNISLHFDNCDSLSCQKRHLVLTAYGFSPSYIDTLGSPFGFTETRESSCKSLLELRNIWENSEIYQNSELPRNDHIPLNICEALLEYESDQDLFLQLCRNMGPVPTNLGNEELNLWSQGSFRNETTQYLEESLDGCRICLDNTGRLGIVPAAAQKGDVFCMFEGLGSYPCLLRQRDKNGWNLISGDCYFFEADKSEKMLLSELKGKKEKEQFDIW